MDTFHRYSVPLRVMPASRLESGPNSRSAKETFGSSDASPSLREELTRARVPQYRHPRSGADRDLRSVGTGGDRPGLPMIEQGQQFIPRGAVQDAGNRAARLVGPIRRPRPGTPPQSKVPSKASSG